MSEHFKLINHCSSYNYWGYEVGEHGTIIDLKTGEALEQFDLNGYLIVKLIEGERTIPVYIHRLVADAFVTPPWRCPRSYTAGVRHVDGNTHNNYWENLEYTRRVEQPIDYHILTGSWTDLVRWNQKPVRCIELDEVFPSVSMAARVLRLGQGNIASHLKGRLPHVSHYTFEFYDGR
jgi:hypothetical protein